MNDLRSHRRNLSALRPATSNRRWYSIQNAEADTAEIRIYDVIGWPFITADEFVGELEKVKAKTINLRINSPGGDVFEGIPIHNALDRHPAKIVAHIDGLAASTASWIAMAADEVRIADNAYMMIHNPLVVMVGGAEELRKEADLLDKITRTIAEMYSRKSGRNVQQFIDAMADETWYSAEDARGAGLADVVTNGDGTPVQNRFDLSIYNNVPETLRDGRRDVGNVLPQTPREFERFLRDAGYSNAQAKAIASQGFKPKSEPRDEDDGELLSVVRAHVASAKSLFTEV